MSTRRLKSVDHLSGQGLLIPEGQEGAGVPVRYKVDIGRWMIRPMPGDQEIPGTFNVAASVDTDQPVAGLLGDNQYHLQLADGMRVGVFVQSTTVFSTHYKLGISDGNELAKKYEHN